MPATRQVRASHKHNTDEALKRSAEPAPDAGIEPGLPALPDLEAASLEPEAWLALQQTIGNSAVGGLVERRRAGQALPNKARHEMEGAFGQNFGQVQVHAGPEVDQATQALDAAAFTSGPDVFVHSSVADFGDPLGRQVLGEELAHVAQGVGQDGPSRLTDPGETAEREAHRAGAAAAAGRRASVSAAPEAAGAVARFSLTELEEEAKKKLGLVPDAAPADKTAGEASGEAGKAAEAVAAAAEKSLTKTELTDEEKDRLSAGVLEPLNTLWTELGTKQMAAPDGKPAAQELQPLVDNSGGLAAFIYSFAGPPEIQAALEQAAVGAAAGHNALLAAINPQKTIEQTADKINSTASEIDALAVTPSATAEPASPDELTPSEAEQLKAGAADPLRSVSEQLHGAKPDLDVILGRLRSMPAMLRSFSKPAKLVPQLHRKAISVEIAIQTLEAVHGGAKAAINEAMSAWQSAIVALRGLTVKSGGGGGAPTTTSETGGGSGDEDKKKPM
jgi:hypothetical protein